jgi:hypothetical protein
MNQIFEHGGLAIVLLLDPPRSRCTAGPNHGLELIARSEELVRGAAGMLEAFGSTWIAVCRLWLSVASE